MQGWTNLKSIIKNIKVNGSCFRTVVSLFMRTVQIGMLTWYVVSRRKKFTKKMAHDSFVSKFVFHKIHESIFTLKLQWIIFIVLILICYQQPTIIKKSNANAYVNGETNVNV